MLGGAIADGLREADLAAVLRLAAAVPMAAGMFALARQKQPAAIASATIEEKAASAPSLLDGGAGDAVPAGEPALASPAVAPRADTQPLAASHPSEPAQVRALRMVAAGLEGSPIAIGEQDAALRYTRIYNPLPGYAISPGSTDEDVLPPESSAEVRALKQQVLQTGEPVETEITVSAAGRPRWFKLRLERAGTEPDSGVLSVVVDVTSERESEQHLRSLLRELTHRSRNLLAVIQGIARRTAASSGDVDSFVDRFSGRLQALAGVHDILIDSAWRGAPLRELVQVQLAHLGARGEGHFIVEGAPLTLKPEAAQHLSLALHELGANAIEHGALSAPGGHVRVTWTTPTQTPDCPGDDVEFVWREEGGPPVTEPERSGFGQIVLDRLAPRGLDGQATLQFLPDGVVWRLNFPCSNLLGEDEVG